MKLLKKLSIIFGIMLVGLSNLSAVSQEERDALVAIYDSTDGDNWNNHDNWKNGDPCSNSWHGIICNFGYVQHIMLYDNNLRGTIPVEIGNLTNLLSLSLGGNQLASTIPTDIGNLTNLSYLDLGENQFTGTIPTSIGNLTNLTALLLLRNQLIGTIPTGIENLTDLNTLLLEDNHLTGTIPPGIVQLTGLRTIWLGRNQLTGPIPSGIENLTNLTYLSLFENNLTGTIPTQIGNLVNLDNLLLNNNKFTGSIPKSISNLTKLMDLRFNNNQLTGAIPNTIGNLIELTNLTLDQNNLSGEIPTNLIDLINLTWLRMAYNCNLYSDNIQVQDFIDSIDVTDTYQEVLDTNSHNCRLISSDIPVLKTGQIKSYDTDGNVITDGSIKDDGYHQEGADQNYTRAGDIVVDNTTGLMWADNKSIEKRWVTQENYDLGDYNNTSGDTGVTYCSELILGEYSDWRLASVEEIQTLVNLSKSYPAVDDEIFHHIPSSSLWWSSSSVTQASSEAWYIFLGQNGTTERFRKNESLYIKCVRGFAPYPKSLSRNNDIVFDENTGLQWQDDNVTISKESTWIDAINYCEKLSLGGYIDWRLPNRNELLSTLDYTRIYPALNTDIFENYIPGPNGSYSFWTSTTNIDDTYGNFAETAWMVSSSDGRSSPTGKGFELMVRCTRDGQSDIHHTLNPSIIMYLLN